jgi:hypothetical protein
VIGDNSSSCIGRYSSAPFEVVSADTTLPTASLNCSQLPLSPDDDHRNLREAAEQARRRFPPPWSVEETAPCFIVRDAKGQALAFVYGEDEPGRAGHKASIFATINSSADA